MKQPSFLARKSFGQPNYFLLALAIAFLVAFVPRGARKAIEGNNNKAEDWLPANYAESIDLRWFRDHFVGEQFALVSWDGCTIGNDEKLQRLAKRLMPSEQEVANATSDSEADIDIRHRAEWYSKVITGPGVLEQLTSEPMSFSYGSAIKRIEGALVGPVKRDADGKSLGHDSRTTCLVVYLSEAATLDNRTMRKAIENITAVASNECAISEESIHMGGPPVDNITIDVEGERTLIRLASLSGIVGLVLSYWCFRSIKLTGVVFAVGVLSAGMSLAIVFYFGIIEVMFLGLSSPRLGTVDAILMSMPAVVYVLGLSGAIHVVNYYRDARRESGVAGAAETAIKLGWGPCALAAFTTAVGLGSLYTSDILPIKKFGMFTAIAVMGTVGLLFTVLPVFLHRFPVSEDQIKRQSGDRDKGHLPDWANRLFGFVVGRYALTCTFWFIVMGALAIGFTRIETSVSLLKLLDEDTDLIHDYAWLESNLGNLVPMEVVLTVPPERCRTPDQHAEADGKQYRSTMLERLNMVRMIKRRMEQLPEISRVMSIATYTPENTDSGLTSANRSVDYATNISLKDERQTLLESDYLRVERTSEGKENPTGRELIRLSARVAALNDEDDESIDYGEFVKQLKLAVDPVLVALEQRDKIVAQLNANGKKLAGANLCVLYRSPDGKFPEQSQEAVIRELLAQSGTTTGKVSTYNLTDLDSLKGDPNYDRYVKRLGKQDALILVSASSDPTAKELVESGLTIIDVTDVSVYEESAVVPLALDGSPRPIRAVYTGMIPLVFKTQRQLLLSLRESIGWATVLISVVMMFVLRSPLAGLISMIPNIFPIVIIFGSLGWLGIKVDIGIMMTASVALGVAVDDTIHFLTWFRRGISQGMDRVQAVMLAYDRCATAMLQTTIIGGLGLAVFATSTFTPTQQFGYLMISMLGAALVGDLLLLPAILVSPLGRPFGGKAPAGHIPVNKEDSLQVSAKAETEDDSVMEPTVLPIKSEARLEQQVDEPAASEQPSYSVENFKQEMQEGPHSALHAKLRSLRREHPQDSVRRYE